MSIAIASIVVLVAVAAVGFFIVRRAMRLAIRLIFIGAILLAVLAGAFALWYQSGSSTTSSPQTERRPTTTPRRTSNSTR
jgi:ABC-type proline/glycine betaine transport system permease subunit